jgi:hypothetical protein
MLPDFWRTANEMDWARKEDSLSVIPELKKIIQHRPPLDRI